MQTSVFFYVHEPTRGTWVDIDQNTDWDFIRAKLFWAGHCVGNYSGPVLASDAYGIGAAFVTPEGGFDLPELQRWLAADLLNAPAGAVVAYLSCGEDATPSPERFVATYCGEWDSVADFVCSGLDAARGDFYSVIDGKSQAVYIFRRD